MTLMRGITVKNGYRQEFVNFMRIHLVEPRREAFDKVYEWARGHEAARRGMPGCRCMQNLLMSIEHGWRDLPGVDKTGARYGGNPSPARGASKAKPAPKPKPKGDPIVDAIRRLDPRDRALWTRSGKPRVDAVEKLLGEDITAAERDKAWAAVQSQPKPTPTPAPKPPPNTSPPPPSQSLLSAIKSSRRAVSAHRVAEAIRNSDLKDLRPSLLDRTYTALPLEVWQDILEWSDVDRMAYVSEKRDCDNFAVALAGQVSLRLAVNGCGIVVDYSGKHAYNCILVCDDKDQVAAMLVEPQSDRMPQVGDRLGRNEAYKAHNGWILFA